MRHTKSVIDTKYSYHGINARMRCTKSVAGIRYSHSSIHARMRCIKLVINLRYSRPIIHSRMRCTKSKVANENTKYLSLLQDTSLTLICVKVLRKKYISKKGVLFIEL